MASAHPHQPWVPFSFLIWQEHPLNWQVCAPNAYWRHSEYTSYGQEPPCEKASMHVERQRGVSDRRFSDLEKYFGRPLALTTADTATLPTPPRQLLFADYLKYFEVVTTGPAVRPPTATELDESGGDASLLAGVTRDGRGVYRVRLSDDRPTEDGAPYSEEYFYYRRKAHLRRYTRLTRVPHTAGHVHFARILIKRCAATSFAELRTTTDGAGVATTHETYEEACRALGLLESDAIARELLYELVQEDSPRTVRSLFVRLTLDGVGLLDVLKSTDPVPGANCRMSVFEFMCSEFVRNHLTSAAVCNTREMLGAREVLKP
jgi:hypothetical protein